MCSAGGDASEEFAEELAGPGALPDLPLWRVQWATLPGTQVSALPTAPPGHLLQCNRGELQRRAAKRPLHSQLAIAGREPAARKASRGFDQRDIRRANGSWTVVQEVLHVHVPHYIHMFDTIMAGPRPWRFGHVYLPGGSEALGTPAAAISPRQPAQSTVASGGGELGGGTAGAPTVGTVMEVAVTSADRSPVRARDTCTVSLHYRCSRMRLSRPVTS